MIALATLALFVLSDLGSSEIVGGVGAVVVSIGAAVGVLMKWLPRHFDQLVAAHAKDRGQSRVDFLSALDRQAGAFTSALGREVAECARQRELDREQRELDRQERGQQHDSFLRVVGFLQNADTGAFRVQHPAPKPRSGSSEDARRKETPQ